MYIYILHTHTWRACRPGEAVWRLSHGNIWTETPHRRSSSCSFKPQVALNLRLVTSKPSMLNKKTPCRHFLQTFPTWSRPAWSWVSGRMDQSPDTFILFPAAAVDPAQHAGRLDTRCEWFVPTNQGCLSVNLTWNCALGFALRSGAVLYHHGESIANWC